MHAVLTEKEQATVDSIIHHHQQQSEQSKYRRYSAAKNDLWKAQRIGTFSCNGKAYDAAIKQFCNAFGV